MPAPGRVSALIILVAVTLAWATPRPPERVAPGVISTDRNETFPVVDPVDGSLWFSVYDDNFNAQTIMVAVREGDGWQTPRVAPFSGTHGDRAPRFSPDGRTLYFTSNRPDGAGAGGTMRLWAADRTRTGWSEPRLLPAPVNAPGSISMHAAATPRALWLASNRPPNLGRSDIWRIAKTDTGWGEATHLPAPVNSALSQPDLLVDPDERWIILAITDHPDGLGGDDLFVVTRAGDGWSAPRHLPAPINSSEYEYGPTLSPDGTTLWFTSHRSGSADVYRVPLAELGLPR